MAGLGKIFGGLFGKPSVAQAELPALEPGQRIYAIGDIHGRLDLLQRLADLIAQDLAINPVDYSIEVFVGDYVDRGTQSAGVLDWLIHQPPVCSSRVALKGNHEEFLLGFLNQPGSLAHWKSYGGVETLNSYGVHTSFQIADDDFGQLHEQLCARMPSSHYDFLTGLPLTSSHGPYFFAHAGVRPGVALESQVADDLLWIREPFLSSRDDFGKIVVHGHTPQERPEVLSNRINIDTGAYITGCLTCVVLEAGGPRFLATRELNM